MPTQEQMTINEHRKYLKLMLPCYRNANRAEQSRLLIEMQTVTTLERKRLIRLLNGETLDRQPRQRQRGVTYNHHFDDALRVLAETLDYAMCVPNDFSPRSQNSPNIWRLTMNWN